MSQKAFTAIKGADSSRDGSGRTADYQCALPLFAGSKEGRSTIQENRSLRMKINEEIQQKTLDYMCGSSHTCICYVYKIVYSYATGL